MHGLELERVQLTLVDHQNVGNVGNAGHDAERLEDRGLDRGAPAAGGVVKHEQSRRAAPAQVFEHAAL
jgi:hypothetical protein